MCIRVLDSERSEIFVVDLGGMMFLGILIINEINSSKCNKISKLRVVYFLFQR